MTTKETLCNLIREYRDPSDKSLYITRRIGMDLAEHLLTSLREQGIIVVPPSKGELYEIVKNVYGKEDETK